MNTPVRGTGKGPKAVSCYICGRQYMIHSFEIHEKQCRELFEKREAEKLPKERKKCPANPMGGARLTGSKSDIDTYNAAASETWSTSLSKCKFCGRSFLPEKLAIHNKSCRADNVARGVKDPVNRSPASLDAHEYSSTSNSHTDSYNRPSSSSDIGFNQNSSAPPTEYSSGGATKECSECGRSFNSTAFMKHTKICHKVFATKRKVFDSAKARAKGTENAVYQQKTAKSAGRSGSTSGINRASGGRTTDNSSGSGSNNKDLQAAYNLRDSHNRGSASSNSHNGNSGNSGNMNSASSAMPKWKRDSLAFRQAMRAARAYEAETAAANSNSSYGSSPQPRGGPVRGGPVRSAAGNSQALRGVVGAKPVGGMSSGRVGGGIGGGGGLSASGGGIGGRVSSSGSRVRDTQFEPDMSGGHSSSGYGRSNSSTGLSRGKPLGGTAPSRAKPQGHGQQTLSHGQQQQQQQQQYEQPQYQQQQQFSDVDPSYLQCPHCSRSFNEKAGERHIPLCKGIINKPSRLSKGSGAPSHSTNSKY